VTELTLADFDAFFSALWGTPKAPRNPFQWQRDLARRVLDDKDTPWPEAIALPTASGKTACIDIAVFAMAAQASRVGTETPIDAPRRVFFVVDRRVIVDEAYDRAARLAAKLRDARAGILKTVADNLRCIARGEPGSFESEIPLATFVLRGGMYRSEAWARDPLQPTIIASTVDQLGSRLLFRAYGRGPGMWPVYAGLAANDSLVLLDEAHCAQPFMQTLQAVRQYRAWSEVPLGRGFHPVIMSATPPSGLERFEDDSAEGRDPEHPLGRRQLARKPSTLEVVAKAKGAKGTVELAKALACAAEALVDELRRAVVVFVNRVATARAVHALLQSGQGERVVTLLTGRMRPVDKDEVIANQLGPLASESSDSRRLNRAHFVVATQTLEVGADLDFDALVTECASLDALRQRFGRLNRMGRAIDARAAILIRGDQVGGSDDDPVYGPALANTWDWLVNQRGEEETVDLGIAALAERLPDGDDLEKLNAPSTNAPVMLPAHVDAWAQTSPVPEPSPDVALFLHGPREVAADVQVCWRADLTLDTDEGFPDALDALSLCPPSSAECLSVPISVFKRWLAGHDDADQGADVQGVGVPDGVERDDEGRAPRRVVCWRGRDTGPEDLINTPRQIRPGDVLVIPATTQGVPGLGDIPAEVAGPAGLLDVADRAHLGARAKALLRLHPRLVAAWPDGEAKALAQALLEGIKSEIAEEPDAIADAVRELLATLVREAEAFPTHWRCLADIARLLSREVRRGSFRRLIRPVGRDGLYLVGQTLVADRVPQADVFSDEDDASASGISRPDGRPIRLVEHLPGVAAFARRFARGCGLPQELVDACERAGLLHDLGKADPRFQALLRGGNRWAVGEPLAKSGDMPKTRSAARVARAAAGYPEGGRHELLSVRLAESDPQLLPEDAALRDLVLHLVASHHGHCRPFAPVVFDDDPPAVAFELAGHQLHWEGPTGLETLGAGVPDRFWRLARRYGWWGLAWLEALLRLADHRRSEWEERHHDGD